MTAYRFCRTDDVPLLVRAYNACYSEPTGSPTIAVEDFRRWMRQLDVWASSCMVALEAGEPVGVLIGAKRAHGSFLHCIGVRPEHRRRGHARHMLESLARKMAILEPKLLLAEVPRPCEPVARLLETCGYAAGDVLADWVAEPFGVAFPGAGAESSSRPSPVSWADLETSGSLDFGQARTWLRSAETVRAQRDDLRGLAFVSDLRVEAWLLYRDRPALREREVLALAASPAAPDGLLVALLREVRLGRGLPVRMPRVHPLEVPPAAMIAAGYEPAHELVIYTAEATPG